MTTLASWVDTPLPTTVGSGVALDATTGLPPLPLDALTFTQVASTACATRHPLSSTSNTIGVRVYAKLPSSFASAAHSLITIYDSGITSQLLRVSLAGTGAPGSMRLVNSSGTTIATSSNSTFTTGQVVRIEVFADKVGSTCQLQVFPLASDTPIYSSGSISLSFASQFGVVALHNTATTPTVGVMTYDQLLVTDVAGLVGRDAADPLPGSAATGTAQLDLAGSGATSGTAAGSLTLTGAASSSSAVTSAGSLSLSASGAAGIPTAWPQAGGVTPGGAMVTYALTNVSSARIAYSTSNVLASPSYSGSLTPDSDGIVSATLTGLSADTVYYYGLEANGNLLSGATTRGQFRTYPTAGSQASGSFLFGSCQVTDSNHAVFATMTAHSTTYTRYGFFHLGDLHYRAWQTNGITSAATIKAQQKSSTQQTNFAGLLSALPWAYLWDNNDWGGPDSDASNPAAATLEAMYRQMVPHYTTLSDADDASGSIDQTFDFGRVSFYILDTRSQRTNESATDNSSKTMLGAGQKARFKTWMSTNTKPVKVILEGIPYKNYGGASGDRWGSYLTEFQELATYFAASGVGKLYGLAGDLHVNTADDGTNESYGHVPNAVASAFDQSGLSTGGASWSQGIYPASGTNTNHQFGVLDVHDTGSTIVLGFTGYDASDVSNITMTTTINVSSAAVGTASLSLVGSGAAKAPTTAGGSLSLVGTGAAKAPAAASATLSLLGAGSPTLPASGTAALSLVGLGNTAGSLAASGTAAVALVAAGATSAPGSASAALSLTAAGPATTGGSGAGALTMSAGGAMRGAGSGTATLSLGALALGAARASGNALLTLLGLTRSGGSTVRIQAPAREATLTAPDADRTLTAPTARRTLTAPRGS